MLFVIDDELRNLAEIFHKKKSCLYIVGGFVRNKLLGVPDYLNLDIDLCSKSKPEEVEKIVKNTDFYVENVNNQFGVVKIRGKKGLYEHATFRTEKYDFAGAHNPSNVEFIDNVEVDALRRDFRCNSVYYDIYKDELIDPLGGIEDIKNRIIRTTRDPKIVFNDDSERILRMVRQAVCLGFDIDENTYQRAKNNAFKVKLLSKTRIKKEFEKILLANAIYPCLENIQFGHARGVLLLADLNILGNIMPTLGKISKMNIIDDKGRNLFLHIVDTLKLCQEDDLVLRLSILVHDYGKAEALIKTGKFFGHEDLANVLIEQDLGSEGLMYDKKTIKTIKQIVFAQDFDAYSLEHLTKVRKFIIENYLQINNIILLKKYISINKNNKIKFSIKKLIREKNKIESGVYPAGIDDLRLDGKDILELFPNMKNDKISEVLNKLLDICLKYGWKNKHDELIKELDKIIKKNKKYYLEV